MTPSWLGLVMAGHHTTREYAMSVIADGIAFNSRWSCCGGCSVGCA
jgi:hypothetical protein